MTSEAMNEPQFAQAPFEHQETTFISSVRHNSDPENVSFSLKTFVFKNDVTLKG